MIGRAPAILAAVLLTACRPLPDHERAALTYVKANRKGDCEAAWRLLSQRTREAYQWQVERHPAHPMTGRAYRLEDLYCSPNRYQEWDTDSMRTSAFAADEATIAFRTPVWHGFGGVFLPREKSWVDTSLTVVREPAGWRIEDRRILTRMETERAR